MTSIYEHHFGRTNKSYNLLGLMGPTSIPFSHQPAMDIQESILTNLITATIELPGIKKENITIDVDTEKRLIIVHGGEDAKGGTNINDDEFVLKERHTGRFSRSIALPSGIQPEEVNASMDNGLLTITFPKSSPRQATHRVNIS